MVSDEQLLEDLREFAEELGETPTKNQMGESGPRAGSTYYRHFGSWNYALREAGLKVNSKESKEGLLKDLRKFADELGETPTVRKMSDKGPWSKSVYERHFGSWNNALQEAGLEINEETASSKEQLLEDLREFAEELGETPSYNQMDRKGPWDDSTYENWFGSWNNALQEAGLEINRLATSERSGSGESAYGAGYEKARRKVIYRDDYRCRVCDAEEQLHCHHIKPRRTFDDVSNSNTTDNLITLCPTCHGKFEGRWQDADPDEFAENARDVLS